MKARERGQCEEISAGWRCGNTPYRTRSGFQQGYLRLLLTETDARKNGQPPRDYVVANYSLESCQRFRGYGQVSLKGRVSSIYLVHGYSISLNRWEGGAEMLLQETLKLHDKQSFDFHYVFSANGKKIKWWPAWKQPAEKSSTTGKNNFGSCSRRAEIIRYIQNNNIELVPATCHGRDLWCRLIHKRTGRCVIPNIINREGAIVW